MQDLKDNDSLIAKAIFEIPHTKHEIVNDYQTDEDDLWKEQLLRQCEYEVEKANDRIRDLELFHNEENTKLQNELTNSIV